jgi:predicted regulator of Ras-like GTPase activity (Roadblock/LC7/MglB family)
LSSAYETACDSLARLVSRRAAEELLGDALRRAGRVPALATPDDVRAALSERVLARLEGAVGPARARDGVNDARRRLAPEAPTKPSEEIARPATLPPRSPQQPGRPVPTFEEVAREDFITGQVVCDLEGTVLRARLPGQSRERLAAVAAASVMLLERAGNLRVLHCQFEEGHAFVTKRGDEVLTLLANSQVNVGRVLSDLRAQQESP